MRPLAVEKERQNDNTAAAAQRVSQSVGHSVTQTASQPSPPEHCNHKHKPHPQSSTIRANHASRWLLYVRQLPCSRTACTKSSSAWRGPHISLHHTARTDQTARAAQTKRINTNDKPSQPRSTRASSSKWQCQRKGGAPNHSHISTYRILMPQKSAIGSVMP